MYFFSLSFWGLEILPCVAWAWKSSLWMSFIWALCEHPTIWWYSLLPTCSNESSWACKLSCTKPMYACSRDHVWISIVGCLQYTGLLWSLSGQLMLLHSCVLRLLHRQGFIGHYIPKMSMWPCDQYIAASAHGAVLDPLLLKPAHSLKCLIYLLYLPKMGQN